MGKQPAKMLSNPQPTHLDPPAVFLSYAREDSERVGSIASQLRARGIVPHSDCELEPGPDFKEQIRQLILKSDVILPCLSPDFVVSDACRDEIDQATSWNKLILPVVVRQGFADAAVQKAIRKPEWTYVTADGDLISGMDRLSNAIRTDFDLVPMHTYLLGRADEWDRRKRDPSLLLLGQDLKAAEVWYPLASANREQLPNPTVSQLELIFASRRAEAHRRNVRLVTSLCVALALGVLAVIAFRSYQQSRKQEAVITQKLVTQADSLSNAAEPVHSQTSLLLAAEALKRTPSATADNVIRSVSAGTPVAIGRMKHEAAVTSLVFTPDGLGLLSGSEDKTVRFWNARTGKELAKVSHKYPVQKLVQDGRSDLLAARAYSITGGPESIRVWRFTPTSLEGPVYEAEYAHRTAAIFLFDRKLRIVDGDHLRTVTLIPGLPVSEQQLPEAGSLVEKTRTETAPGKLLNVQLPGAETVSYAGKHNLLLFASNSRIVSYDLANGQVKKLNPPRRHTQFDDSTGVPLSGDGQVLGTLDETEELGASRSFREWSPDLAGLPGRGVIKPSGDIYQVALSGNGKLVAFSHPEGVSVWNVESREEIGRADGWRLAEGRDWRVLQFSGDGSELAASHSDGALSIFTVEPWQESFHFGVDRKLSGFAWGPDAQTVATGFEDGSVGIWKLDHSPDAWSVPADSFAYSPSGNYAVVTQSRSGTKIFNREGRQIRSLPASSSIPVVFSPDERRLAWVDRDRHRVVVEQLLDRVAPCAFDYAGALFTDGFLGNRIVAVLDTGVGEWKADDCKAAGITPISGLGSGLHLPGRNVAYLTPGGRFAAFASPNDRDHLSLWDVRQHMQSSLLPVAWWSSLAFSPDETLVADSGGKQSSLWRVRDGRELWHSDRFAFQKFDPTGSWLAAALGATLRVYNIRSGKVVLQHRDDRFSPSALAFDRTGQYLATVWVHGGWPAQIRILRVADDVQVSQITLDTTLNNNFELTFSPDGRFVIARDDTQRPPLMRAFWWLQPDIVREACKHAVSNLSAEEWRRDVGLGSASATCPVTQPPRSDAPAAPGVRR